MGNSIWEEHINYKKRGSLSYNLNTGIVVVGGGLTGILAAYYLQKAGEKVVVLEAEQIGGGITKHTTAKVTAAHNLIYDYLIQKFGYRKAKQYAESNMNAVKEYAQLIKEKDICCDMEQTSNYVYTRTNNKMIYKEYEAMQKLSMPVNFTADLDLPFSVEGAVELPNQLQIHPLKFINAIAEELTIYENTKVVNFLKDNLLEVYSSDRNKLFQVSGKDIIMATHYPVLNIPGFYFLKMHQERGYVLGIRETNGIQKGMYIDESKTGFSFRRYGDYILLGGSCHRTGENEAGGAYEKLFQAAKYWYPQGEAEYQWSNQDCMSLDRVPYIGRYSNLTKHLYVATGFNKWGMSTAMLAAQYLREHIVGKERGNSVFSPRRHSTTAVSGLEKEIKTVTKNLCLQLFCLPKRATEDIGMGCGGIVTYKNQKVGVYKDYDGTVYSVDTKCPHLGCMLSWNPDELSWDCPCHGSRFDYRGQLIDNPSVVNTAVCQVHKKNSG
ncbi:FAD-dependent oxidoreductase [Anaeromicropila populeti]|uniref:Glycine/D-amino acid oxidase n=1 Tax=Anaeromicropila populeti TaxID=37658 RepID=A0A1I6JXS5_9FIRM|nr:FAD-dependent oxidoreductase [Anaeromicropila populeti]SFR83779.1 Glycine/D-amino acid oxidase [Anaeromicropila populeti]